MYFCMFRGCSATYISGFYTIVWSIPSNIRCTKSLNLNVSRLTLETLVDNEDVVGAMPTGDAPTTSE